MTRATVYRSTEAALDFLLARASAVYRSTEAGRPQRAAGLWAALTDCAQVLTGHPLEVALQANLDKLDARAKAGELQTHGQ